MLLVDGRPVQRSAVDAVRAEFRLGGTADTEARAEKEAVRRELVRREAERLGVVADPRRGRLPPRGHGRPARRGAGPRDGARARPDDGRAAAQRPRGRRAARGASGRQVRRRDGHRGGGQGLLRRPSAAFRQTASAHLWTIQVAAERIAESALGAPARRPPLGRRSRASSRPIPRPRRQGGDMGTVALSSLPAPLRKAVEATPDGKVAARCRGPAGWYLLKTTGRTRRRASRRSPQVKRADRPGADQAQALRGAGGLAGRRPRPRPR